MRGQATSIQHPARGNLRHQQPDTFWTGLPSTPRTSIIPDRLNPEQDHEPKVRTFRIFIPNTWKPPDVSSLHNFCRTGTRQSQSRSKAQTFFSSKDIFAHLNTSTGVTSRIGGAERDRTADPLLAKQVLSQLSYSPNRFDSQHQSQTRLNQNGGPGQTRTADLTLIRRAL